MGGGLGSTVERFSVVDAVRSPGHEEHLYGCLPPFTRSRRYRKRLRYVEEAAPRGLRKMVVLSGGDAVGQIEYAPAAASAYPVIDADVWVMNCVWVLSRAKGHGLGKELVRGMLDAIGEASGVATIGLSGHWSPWLRRGHMEHLGFTSAETRLMRHRVKRPETSFEVHLMWMPIEIGAHHPRMDWDRLSMGVDSASPTPSTGLRGLAATRPWSYCEGHRTGGRASAPSQRRGNQRRTPKHEGQPPQAEHVQNRG
jgi:hypothetical protein